MLTSARKLLLLVLPAACAAALLGAGPAAAAGSCPAGSTLGADGQTCTATFSYTGSPQTFTVPAGASSVSVVADGAAGGGVTSGFGVHPGLGGQESGTVSGLQAGQVLTVIVGGVGQTGVYEGAGGQGGYGGGGAGGTAGVNANNAGGAGGGGGSFVFGPSGLLLAAGGGGGGGTNSFALNQPAGLDSYGGNGGGTAGGASGDADWDCCFSALANGVDGLGGGGASTSAGQGASPGGTEVNCPGPAATAGSDGSGPATAPDALGDGGTGGGTQVLGTCTGPESIYSGQSLGNGAGGGGGGYFGGGGGSGGVAGGGGGGGGAGYAAPGVSNAQSATGTSLNGQVQISFIPGQIQILTSSLPNGVLNDDYLSSPMKSAAPVFLNASGGTSPYTWSIIAGALPDGLSVDGSSGEISGTPTKAGTFSFTVQVADSSSPALTNTANLSIEIDKLAVSSVQTTHNGAVDTSAEGGYNGGETVTVNGEGFTEAGPPSVSFAGNGFTLPAQIVGTPSDTQIEVISPPIAPGQLSGGQAFTDVIVTSGSDQSARTSADGFTYVPPTVTSVTPSAGSLTQSTAVTVHGVGLAGAGQVILNPTAANPSVASQTLPAVSSGDDTVTFTAPSLQQLGLQLNNGNLFFDTQVVVPFGGQSSTSAVNNPADAFQYGGVTIAFIDPSSSSPAGGGQIAITGQGFGKAGSADTVTLQASGGASLQATSVDVISDSTITATIPAETGAILAAGGQTNLQVKTSAGLTSNAVPFDYAAHIGTLTYHSTSPAGGTQVTINGSGFGPAGTHDAVGFLPTGSGSGQAATNVTVVSDTEITATIPAEPQDIYADGGNAEVDVEVPIQSGGMAASNSIAFAYEAHIDNLSYDSTSPAGGTQITLDGSGFGPPGTRDDVAFLPTGSGSGSGQSATNVTVVSDTEITATIPAEPQDIYADGGNADVHVDVPIQSGGLAASNQRPFSYAVHLGSSVAHSSSPAGGTQITLAGSGFGPPGTHDDVAFLPTGSGSGQRATDVRVLSDTLITATIPAETKGIGADGGAANVQVLVPIAAGGLASSNDLPYTYGPDPSIEHASQVNGTTASASVGCAGKPGSDCSFTLEITSGGGPAAHVVLADAKRRPHPTVLGRITVKVKAGRRKLVRITLNRTGRKLLATRHHLKATVLIVESGRTLSSVKIMFKSRRR